MSRATATALSNTSPPEAWLRLAIEAKSAKERARYARTGLSAPDEDLSEDTQALLLRQLYLALIDVEDFREALKVARQMARVGTLRDLGHHDASRACMALGELEDAIREQRLAARHAPPRRRSFHLWSLGTLEHFAGDPTAAIATFRRAERWAQRDLPLIRAHAAYVQLDAGEMPEGLEEIVASLMRAKCREGYGQFLLGMLHESMGDHRRAAVHLRAFMRRNALLDLAKATTLREELRRARAVLASIESD